MNRRQFLYAGASAGLAACWVVPSAADVASKETPKAESDYQDVVYFAGSRPVLLPSRRQPALSRTSRPINAAPSMNVTVMAP